jgi:hypothetical protein
VLAIPNKLLFLSADFESHEISPEVERLIRDFLDHHGVDDVRIRLGEYAPLGELGRLLANGRVNVLLRLLIGPLLWLGYALNVGRIFGGDHYNAFSDTVNLYSGHPVIALHEVGHVLDFRQRRHPGLYALLRFVPGVSLYQEYVASRYAIEFLRLRGLHDEEITAYRLLFPTYSTYVFGTLVDLFPSSATRWLALPIVACRHLLGNGYASRRIAALGTHAITLAGQWAHELRRAVEMFSMGTPMGRRQVGVVVGLLAGSAMCGYGAPFGVVLGYLLAKAMDPPGAWAPGRG